MLSPGYRKR